MKEISQSKVTFTVQEISYYLFFSLLFFAKGIGLYDGQNLFKVFLVAAIVCYAVKICITEYEIREIILILLILSLAAVVYHNTKEKGILLIAMTVTGMKGISVKKLLKTELVVWCISAVPLIILTMAGVLDSPFKVHVKPVVGYVIRWGLGYVHPNVAHISYFVFAVLLVYVMSGKSSGKLLLALFFGNCFVFGYTVSFTGFIITSFYLALNWFIQCRNKITKAEYFIAQCILPMCVLISIFLPLILTGKAFDVVNKLMNTRLRLAKLFLTEETITLFGKGMQMTTDMLTMDNSFVFAFMTYGIVTFLVICAGYMLLAGRLAKKHANRELIILITFLIAGISEPFLFNTSFKNITLVFLGAFLFEGMSVQEKKNQRTFCLIPRFNQEIEVKSGFAAAMKERIGLNLLHKNKQIAVGVLIGCITAAILTFMLQEPPKRIIVPKKICDSVDTMPIYIKAEAVNQNKEDLVMGYEDEQTPMLVFEGNLIQIEMIRIILIRIVLGGIAGGLVLLFIGRIPRY